MHIAKYLEPDPNMPELNDTALEQLWERDGFAANPDDDNAPGSPPELDPSPGRARHDPDPSDPPWPDGPTIARQFHTDYRGFARKQLTKSDEALAEDADHYARYMSERLPKQPPLTVEHVLMVWRLAAQYAI